MMDSEDELLCALALVAVKQSVGEKRSKRKHKLCVQEIYRERAKYGVPKLARTMRFMSAFFYSANFFLAMLKQSLQKSSVML